MAVYPEIKLEHYGREGFLRDESNEIITTEDGTPITWDGKAWDEISWDVRGRTHGEQGILANGPMNRMANVGRANFTMNNAADNVAGLQGYYSPGHANAKTDWKTGEKIRISFKYGGTAYERFYGELTEITPKAGQYGPRDVRCTALDYMNNLNSSKVGSEQDLLTDTTSDLGYTALIADMTVQPEGTSFETGTVQLGNLFHRATESSGLAREELNRIILSTFDMMWVTRAGVLKSINKDDRIKKSAGSVDYSLNNEITDLAVSFSNQNRADKVTASYYPTKTATEKTTIYELNSPVRLNPGDTIVKRFEYKDSNTSRKVGASGVAVKSYSFGAADNGTADELHDDLSVTLDARACVAFVTFENTGDGLGHINVFELEGYTITTFDAVEVQDVYNSSGGNELRINMPYQDNAAFAENATKAISNIYGVESRKARTVKFNANRSEALLLNALQTDVNSFIHVTETVTGVNEDLFVNGVAWDFIPGKKLDFTLYTAPSYTGTAGIWGTTKWGQCVWKFMEN